MPTKVSEYMTAKVVTVAPDTGIREAFFIMKENSIRHLPAFLDVSAGTVPHRE